MNCNVIDDGTMKLLVFEEDASTPKVAARMATLAAFDDASPSNPAADGAGDIIEAAAKVVDVECAIGNPVHAMSLEAIAAYTELLGNDSYEETVRDIMFIREHGEPDPDPVTGVNAWTSAYEELESRGMQVAIEATRSSLEETESQDCGISIQPASLSQNRSGDLTGISKTRSLLGLPPKDASQPVAMRLAASDDPTDISNYEVPDDVIDAISQFSGYIDKYREEFKAMFIPKQSELKGEAYSGIKKV